MTSAEYRLSWGLDVKLIEDALEGGEKTVKEIAELTGLTIHRVRNVLSNTENGLEEPYFTSRYDRGNDGRIKLWQRRKH